MKAQPKAIQTKSRDKNRKRRRKRRGAGGEGEKEEEEKLMLARESMNRLIVIRKFEWRHAIVISVDFCTVFVHTYMYMYLQLINGLS